jgi:hypothetical protein
MVSKLDDFVNKTFLSLHKIWLELANPRTQILLPFSYTIERR